MSAILFLLAIVAGLIGLGWGFVVAMACSFLAGMPAAGDRIESTPASLFIPPAAILLAALTMFIVALFL